MSRLGSSILGGLNLGGNQVFSALNLLLEGDDQQRRAVLSGLQGEAMRRQFEAQDRAQADEGSAQRLMAMEWERLNPGPPESAGLGASLPWFSGQLQVPNPQRAAYDERRSAFAAAPSVDQRAIIGPQLQTDAETARSRIQSRLADERSRRNMSVIRGAMQELGPNGWKYSGDVKRAYEEEGLPLPLDPDEAAPEIAEAMGLSDEQARAAVLFHNRHGEWPPGLRASSVREPGSAASLSPEQWDEIASGRPLTGPTLEAAHLNDVPTASLLDRAGRLDPVSKIRADRAEKLALTKWQMAQKRLDEIDNPADPMYRRALQAEQAARAEYMEAGLAEPGAVPGGAALADEPAGGLSDIRSLADSYFRIQARAAFDANNPEHVALYQAILKAIKSRGDSP